MIGDLSRIAMKKPFFMANHAENLQIDTQMALFMSESSVPGGTGLRHYGIAGSRDLAMHDERPVLQQKCPFALQMNEKNPDLQQRQPSLLQNARPNLNICVTYSARPTRHDKRGEADTEAAAANPGASGFPSSARLVPMQSISRLGNCPPPT